jgi:hypothetical protein
MCSNSGNPLRGPHERGTRNQWSLGIAVYEETAGIAQTATFACFVVHQICHRGQFISIRLYQIKQRSRSGTARQDSPVRTATYAWLLFGKPTLHRRVWPTTCSNTRSNAGGIDRRSSDGTRMCSVSNGIVAERNVLSLITVINLWESVLWPKFSRPSLRWFHCLRCANPTSHQLGLIYAAGLIQILSLEELRPSRQIKQLKDRLCLTRGITACGRTATATFVPISSSSVMTHHPRHLEIRSS